MSGEHNHLEAGYPPGELNARIATMEEGLAGVRAKADEEKERLRSSRGALQKKIDKLRAGRTGLTEAMDRMGAIEFVNMDPQLTETGERLFSVLELKQPPSSSRRPAVRRCLDWSERKPHLGGALPAQFLDFMLREKWFVKKGSSRALRITPAGRAGLEETFGYITPTPNLHAPTQ